MRILDPGHSYELETLDDEQGRFWPLLFVKREGEMYPGNIGTHAGVNCQELIRVLIDRLKYLNNQIPDLHNDTAIGLLRGVLYELEERAAKRHKYTLPFDYVSKDVDKIEEFPTCKTCGHIVCYNKDHNNAELNNK